MASPPSLYPNLNDEPQQPHSADHLEPNYGPKSTQSIVWTLVLIWWNLFAKFVWLLTNWRFLLGCSLVMLLSFTGLLVLSYVFRAHLITLCLRLLRRYLIKTLGWFLELATGGTRAWAEALLFFAFPWLKGLLYILRLLYRPVAYVMTKVKGPGWDSNLGVWSWVFCSDSTRSNYSQTTLPPRGLAVIDYFIDGVGRILRGEDWSIRPEAEDAVYNVTDGSPGAEYPDIGWRRDLVTGSGPSSGDGHGNKMPNAPTDIGWRRDLVDCSSSGDGYRDRMPMALNMLSNDFAARHKHDPAKPSDSLPCMICHVSDRSAEAQPCQHCCMCRDCANSLMQQSEGYSAECPLCRQPISRMKYV